MNDPHVHHDALEFPDGVIVKVTRLVAGQTAMVLQLPATLQDQVVKSAPQTSIGTIDAGEPASLSAKAEPIVLGRARGCLRTSTGGARKQRVGFDRRAEPYLK